MRGWAGPLREPGAQRPPLCREGRFRDSCDVPRVPFETLNVWKGTLGTSGFARRALPAGRPREDHRWIQVQRLKGALQDTGRGPTEPRSVARIVLSRSLLQEATPVTVGRRCRAVPFLYDEAGEALRRRNRWYGSDVD
jgi:hypothetical protein